MPYIQIQIILNKTVGHCHWQNVMKNAKPLATELNDFLQAEKPPKNLLLSGKTALDYFMASRRKNAASTFEHT